MPSSNSETFIQTCRQAKQEAEKLTGEMTDELRERLDKLPKDSDAIAARISHKQNDIDAIHLANPGAVAEFQRRRTEIEDLKKRLKNQTEHLDKERKKLEQTRVMTVLLNFVSFHLCTEVTWLLYGNARC